MSRGDAVRVLARVVRLGAAARPALIEGLTSSKTYLRHGCAFALALMPSDEASGAAQAASDATHAVSALLLSEPTELWHEIARAIGEIGTPALIGLARGIGVHGAAGDERIAWAMAHVGARGGEPALMAMAATDTAVAPLARKALALVPAATGDDVRMTPDAADDLGVNRAFSRQFFEALQQPATADTVEHSGVREAPAAVES